MLRNHEQLGVPTRQSESGVRLLQYFLMINWSHIHNPCPVSGLLLQPARGPVAWLGSHLRGCFRSTCPPPPAFLNKQRVQSAAPDQRRRPWSTALTPTAATAAILRLAGGGLTGRHGAIRMSSSILQTRRHSIYCTPAALVSDAARGAYPSPDRARMYVCLWHCAISGNRTAFSYSRNVFWLRLGFTADSYGFPRCRATDHTVILLGSRYRGSASPRSSGCGNLARCRRVASRTAGCGTQRGNPNFCAAHSATRASSRTR